MRTSPSNRSAQPPASGFYRQEFQNLSRPSRGWARTSCCFHHGDNPTSLALNIETGGFYCHACGAKGGDLIDFIMLRDGLSFKGAAKRLGAWDESGRVVKPTATSNKNEAGAIAKWEQAERELRLHYRDEMHLYERSSLLFQRLLRKNTKDDKSWGALSDTLDLLRRTIAGYYVLSFAAMKTRWQFLSSDAVSRECMIADVLNRGFVCCDGGHQLEVVFP